MLCTHKKFFTNSNYVQRKSKSSWLVNALYGQPSFKMSLNGEGNVSEGSLNLLGLIKD